MRLERNEAIKRIKAALRTRSGRAWSVVGGRGTSWGWIRISSPPSRRDALGNMTDADREELGRLLGLTSPIHHQGEQVPSGSRYREEYVARAEGCTPIRYGEQYWD
jgi:hypothetical protein